MRKVTIAAACLVVLAVAVGRMCNPAPSNGGKQVSTRPDAPTRVVLGPLGLSYYEGEKSLRLTAELGSDAKGAFYYVYVWTPATWVREMPEWCRHRRDEVLAEIRQLTADRRIEWIEED